jgi:hypothetical protein
MGRKPSEYTSIENRLRALSNKVTALRVRGQITSNMEEDVRSLVRRVDVYLDRVRVGLDYATMQELMVHASILGITTKGMDRRTILLAVRTAYAVIDTERTTLEVYRARKALLGESIANNATLQPGAKSPTVGEAASANAHRAATSDDREDRCDDDMVEG